MQEYYTYAYLREDGTPYYIGKGKGKRAYERHSVNKPPRDRILFLKKNMTEDESFKHEIYMIFVLGRKDLGTGMLRNRTDGGQGPSGNRQKKTKNHKKAIKKSVLKTLTEKHGQWYLLKNTSGVLLKEYGTLRGICKKYDIDLSYANKILTGKRKTYKGWSLQRLSTIS